VPFINVRVSEGVFTADRRKDIGEVASGNWGVGGQPMHTSDVKALTGG
jgi:phenylpyruvate tautomerase PptA (4-oxalocrotonate tautomerase family)